MTYSSRFETALAFAARLHGNQLRKVSNVPYISHLLAVAAIAIEHGATEDQAIAALLHDAIEDQGGEPTEQVIRRMFGNTVAEIVRGCSDTDTIPKPPWQQRKEQYIAHLRQASAAVRLVSAADKLHNARNVLADYRKHGDGLWENFKGGRQGTLWYYRSLTDIFLALGLVPKTARISPVFSGGWRSPVVAAACFGRYAPTRWGPTETEIMTTSLTASDLPQRIQQLLDQRQQHTDAITQIDRTLANVGAALGGTTARAPQPAASVIPAAPKAAKAGRKQRRGRGAFSMSAEAMVLAFLKQKKTATSREINQHFKDQGRTTADNALSTLTQKKVLTRTPLEDQPGSTYSLA